MFPKGTLDDGGLLEDDGGTPCIDKLLPLHVVFVLDTTGSMGEELANIVMNAQAFAQAVSSIKPQGSDKPIPSVKLGAVLYVDEQGEYVAAGAGESAKALQKGLSAFAARPS